MFEQFERLQPRHLLLSVLEVYERYRSEKLKPGAEHYEWDTRVHRKRMVSDIRGQYCEITGCPEWEFPYHDDYLAWMWIQYRKLTAEQKDELGNRLGLIVAE